MIKNVKYSLKNDFVCVRISTKRTKELTNWSKRVACVSEWILITASVLSLPSINSYHQLKILEEYSSHTKSVISNLAIPDYKTALYSTTTYLTKNLLSKIKARCTWSSSHLQFIKNGSIQTFSPCRSLNIMGKTFFNVQILEAYC